MGRFILLVAALFVLVWLVRRALAARGGRDASRAPGEALGALVTCAHCAMHLPRGEALEQAGHYYCSDEHRRLGPAR